MKLKEATFLFGVLVVLLISSSMAAAQTKKVVVKFKPGANSGSYGNTVSGYGTVDFVADAKAGQLITVKLASSNKFLYFNVVRSNDGEAIADDARETTEWSGALPADGSYIIEVYLVRAEARRNKKPVKFTIDIGIQ